MFSVICRVLRGLANDTAGASMVEFAIAFPVLAVVSMGTVDLSLLLYQYNAAAKATQLGARRAVVVDPIATGLGNLNANYWSDDKGSEYYKHIGENCSDASGVVDASICPIIDVICRGADTNGTCQVVSGSGGHTFIPSPTKKGDPASPFDMLFEGDETHPGMRDVFPRLERRFVEIRYRTVGLGFAGRPNLPMEVSVSIRCMTQEFYFIGGLIRWLGSAVEPPDGCAGEQPGWPIPASTTTLIGEDFKTVDPTDASSAVF